MVQNVPYFKDKGDSNSSAGWKVSFSIFLLSLTSSENHRAIGWLISLISSILSGYTLCGMCKSGINLVNRFFQYEANKNFTARQPIFIYFFYRRFESKIIF